MLFTHHSGPTSFRARKKTSTHEADRSPLSLFLKVTFVSGMSGDTVDRCAMLEKTVIGEEEGRA